MKLSFCDQLDWVQSMIKTTQDNNVTDYIDALYAENEIELLWTIRQGAFCDENHIRQRCNR